MQLLGVAITLLVYSICKWIEEKTEIALFNAIILSILGIIMLLLIFNISYEEYNQGGKIITFFLGPATIGLVVPLYKRLELLKGNLLQVITGIIIGSVSGLAVIIILGRILGVDEMVVLSMLPKSASTAIAIEISDSIDGIVAITITGVMIAGTLGYTLSEWILEIFNIKNDISKGIAIGSSSHIMGTLKATELGENIGAMSSLSIVLTGLILVILVPISVSFL